MNAIRVRIRMKLTSRYDERKIATRSREGESKSFGFARAKQWRKWKSCIHCIACFASLRFGFARLSDSTVNIPLINSTNYIFAYNVSNEHFQVHSVNSKISCIISAQQRTFFSTSSLSSSRQLSLVSSLRYNKSSNKLYRWLYWNSYMYLKTHKSSCPVLYLNARDLLSHIAVTHCELFLLSVVIFYRDLE